MGKRFRFRKRQITNAPSPMIPPPFLQLARLVTQETISAAEAHRRAVADDRLLSNMSVQSAIAVTWQVSCNVDVEAGCLAASLLYEWARARMPDQPDIIYKTSRTYVEAATQVLMERADAELYQHASSVAEELVAAARSLEDTRKLGVALTIASRLHLEPYAVDPALDPRKSNYAYLLLIRQHKQDRKAWRVIEDLGKDMPAYNEALQCAHNHLSEAAGLLVGAD